MLWNNLTDQFSRMRLAFVEVEARIAQDIGHIPQASACALHSLVPQSAQVSDAGRPHSYAIPVPDNLNIAIASRHRGFLTDERSQISARVEPLHWLLSRSKSSARGSAQ